MTDSTIKTWSLGALLKAVEQTLSDMGPSGLGVCACTKAMLRVAFEPHVTDDMRGYMMPLADAHCINAANRIMRCKCSCGGKNHGKGAFNCTAEAA